MVITDSQFKEKLIETFKAFDTFCKSHDIKYYAGYGTLIGVVRHHGLIPWDDDIDVLMLPEDYNKLCSFRGKVEGHYDIVDSRDKGYWLFDIAKFVDTNTTLWEYEDRPCITGVYIDIFPLSESTYNEGADILKEYRYLSKKVERSMMKHSVNELTNIIKNRNWGRLKTLIYDVLCRQFFRGYWRKKYEECHKRIKEGKGEYYLCYESMYGERDILRKEWFSSTIDAEFEGMTMKIPSGYDAFLTQVYGDYMKLPPAEKQVTHHAHYFLDLNRRWTLEEILESKKRRGL